MFSIVFFYILFDNVYCVLFKINNTYFSTCLFMSTPIVNFVHFVKF